MIRNHGWASMAAAAWLAVGGLGASAISRLENPGFEVEHPAGQATNWWYYGAAGRAFWAARQGAAGNAFYAAGSAYGGFGQDIPINLEQGRIFTFNISAMAEQNYLNTNTTIGCEFWAGANLRTTVTRNVYTALASNRNHWTFLELVHTNTEPAVDLVKVRCDFANGVIPGGAVGATCQWDDGRFYQTAQRAVTTPVRAKYEPDHGVYLGVLLERGGSEAEVREYNAKAGKRAAVYAKFLVFKRDPFPWDWVGMIKTNCPGAALHLILEPMVDFADFFAPDWGPGQATYAAALDFVTNCAAADMPIFLRFAHEANGDWYPWHPRFSDRYNIPDTVSNETYIAGYRHFAELVHSNAPNVAMVWAPNQGNGPDPLPFYEDVYPGDEYVDWVGLSVYNGWSYGNSNEVLDFQFRNAIEKGYWQDNADYYDDTFENFYWTFSDTNNPYGHHKPMMIAETAAAFEPKYAVSNEMLIAGFESLDGPQFTASNTLARFQALDSDGVVVTNDRPLDDAEDRGAWNWGPWGALYVSNSTDCVDGAAALLLGAGGAFADGYVGGVGRGLATNIGGYNGIVVYVKRDASTNCDPLLTITLRSAKGTATVSRAITGATYYPLKIRFDEMNRDPAFSRECIVSLGLELLTSQTGRPPGRVWVDRWLAANLAPAPYPDQDWWPPGSNTIAWSDATDTAGGWHVWAPVTDPLAGHPDQAVRLSGYDANSNYYIGGNGCSLRPEQRDWSRVSCISLLARRGDVTNAEPLLALSLRDASNVRTAQVSVVVVAEEYMNLQIPFANMSVSPGFDWSNVTAVVLEYLSGTPGRRPSDLYLKQFQTGSASNLLEQDWWMAGAGFQPWGDAQWTQTTDAVAGPYALRISGAVTNPSQWYIGGNGCAVPVPQQDWSASQGLILYAKRGDAPNRVQPKFKITLDNDYAETNGNEAVIESKVANTDYYRMVLAFDDFTRDSGFAWTNIRMLKIELFTGEGGKPCNDLYLDELMRATITLTNQADNFKWKRDWCDQLFALEDFQDSDPADPDAQPDYVNISNRFPNLHMINWFHVKKFEDGFTKDLKLAEDGSGIVAFESYYERIRFDYFLTNITSAVEVFVPGHDSDGDGLDDGYEWAYTGSATNLDADGDLDGDGFSNRSEFIAGTDPANAGSNLTLDLAPAFTNRTQPGVWVSWSSVAGRTYEIKRAETLMTGFAPMASGVPATPPHNTYYDTTATNAGPYFYRIRVTP